jgi:S1-C subfamily serine protease
MMNNKQVGAILLAMLIASVLGAFTNVQRCATTSNGYSPAMIGELGEAATLLIYSQIDATVKIYIPDANWLPTTQYILVPVTIGAMGSGFFVNANGYIATAGHVVFSFTHTNIAQDLYVKYFLVNASFAVLLQALENAGYFFTSAEQMQLLTYIQQYAELQNSLRQVYAVLGEVKSTLTDIQAKGWVARVVSVSPYIERDLALLKIEGLSNCPVLVVGDSDNVVTGDDVYMFGFPGVVTFHAELGPETLLAPSMTKGIISAKRLTNVQTPCFQTDAMITHGNSGGAGLNNNGEVIGICSRGSVSEVGQEVAGFDFLIQSNCPWTRCAIGWKHRYVDSGYCRSGCSCGGLCCGGSSLDTSKKNRTTSPSTAQELDKASPFFLTCIGLLLYSNILFNSRVPILTSP